MNKPSIESSTGAASSYIDTSIYKAYQVNRFSHSELKGSLPSRQLEPLEYMRILVTGCAGFIGFHTGKVLLDRGDEVLGIDNLSDYYDVSLKKARLSQLND